MALQRHDGAADAGKCRDFANFQRTLTSEFGHTTAADRADKDRADKDCQGPPSGAPDKVGVAPYLVLKPGQVLADRRRGSSQGVIRSCLRQASSDLRVDTPS